MVIGGLAPSMFNITDGPSWWSGTRLLPFTSFYLSLTLKTADKEHHLCFYSLDRQKSNIPRPRHTETFIFTICSRCHPQLPALLTFIILCSKSRIHSEQMVRISVLKKLQSLNLMFKKCREHIQRSSGGWHVAES